MLRWVTESLIRKKGRLGKGRLLRGLLRAQQGQPIRSKFGPLLVSDIGDKTNFYCIAGFYMSDYADVAAEVRKLGSGAAFIDIGANAGLFSMIAAATVGSQGVVVAFEPSRRTFAKLIRNAEFNELENFYPFNAALSTASGVARFAMGPPTHSGIGHLALDGDVSVVQLRFDDFSEVFEELIGSRAVLVKIDVEGAEDLVIQSMAGQLRKLNVRTVIAEIDPRFLRRAGSSAEELYARMRSLGFKPRRGLGSAPHYNEMFDRIDADGG